MSEQVHWTGERVVLGESPTEVELEHLQRYRLSSKVCSGRILDVACGTGYGSEILSDGGKHPTIGVDISRETLLHARTESKTTQFVRASVESLPFKRGSFDYIVSFETLEHLGHPLSALSEFRSALEHGGRLVLSTPNRDVSLVLFGGLSSPFHTLEFRYEELRSLLAPWFSHVAICGQGWRKRSRPMRSFDRLVEVLSRLVRLPFGELSMRMFRIACRNPRLIDPPLGWIAALLGPGYDIGPAKSRREDRPKFFIAICQNGSR